MMRRRRFLSIAAAMAATPTFGATTHRWSGQALGADVEIALLASPDQASAAIKEARAIIQKMEALFSLYRPSSDLVRLNTMGEVRQPSVEFLALFEIADECFHHTAGLFDPSVQTLWLANANGAKADPALVDWRRVSFDQKVITLGSGQALTFNGIAQGHATDLVSAALRRHGATRTLVNIGEYHGQGGPWRIGLSDPVQGLIGHRTLTDGALATSSPGAMALGNSGHILHPHARPIWSTVTVEASNAALADGISTAAVMMPMDRMAALLKLPAIRRFTVIDNAGDLRTLI